MAEHLIDDLRAVRAICLRLRSRYVEELDFDEAMFWRKAADRAKELLLLNGVACSGDREAEKTNG